jgi:hypothetical protein
VYKILGGGIEIESFTEELALSLLYTRFMGKKTSGLISVVANNIFIIRNGKTLHSLLNRYV